jgi:hypothetical protein
MQGLRFRLCALPAHGNLIKAPEGVIRADVLCVGLYRVPVTVARNLYTVHRTWTAQRSVSVELPWRERWFGRVGPSPNRLAAGVATPTYRESNLSESRVVRNVSLHRTNASHAACSEPTPPGRAWRRETALTTNTHQHSSTASPTPTSTANGSPGPFVPSHGCVPLHVCIAPSRRASSSCFPHLPDFSSP